MKWTDYGHSPTKVLWRREDDGNLMFCDSSGLWGQSNSGKVKKISGLPTLRNADDWESVEPNTLFFEIWTKKDGPTFKPMWEEAVEKSETGWAYRTETGEELLMLRRADGATWREVPQTNEMVKAPHALRHYRGWLPLSKDHPVCSFLPSAISLTEDRFPYRNPYFAPEAIRGKPKEVEEWVRTGTSPTLAPRQEKERQAIEEHNAKVKRMPVDTGPAAQKAVGMLPGAIPEAVEAIGPMATSLCEAMRTMAAIGENATAKELASTLNLLVKNSSWLLREDRHKYGK